MNASRLVIEGCAISTVVGDEYDSGYVAIEDGRISSVGSGQAPEEYRGEEVLHIDGSGCLATPGLVNCHHHLYQWATRGLAQQATLFEWLAGLYPLWAPLEKETERAAPLPGLDGPRAFARGAAPRRGRRGPGRDSGRERGGHRPLPRPLVRLDAQDRA